MNPYAMFNNKLGDFLDDLRSVIGHLPEYTVLTSSVQFLSKFQEEQNCVLFDRYVVAPYGDQIRNRDEAFLLGEQYSANANSGIVYMLKSVWRSLPDQDKSSVWDHMHVLLLLSERCMRAS